MLQNLTVHEAMPGHVLQLAHARRYAGAAPGARALSGAAPFVEGWAVYAEELMADHGYGSGAATGPRCGLQQLKMQLRMTINAILDIRVHARGMTEAEAMRADDRCAAHQEEGEAAGKWRRALLTSTQLSTYYVGYVEVADIAPRPGAAHPRPGPRPARRDARPRLAAAAPPAHPARPLTGAA